MALKIGSCGFTGGDGENDPPKFCSYLLRIIESEDTIVLRKFNNSRVSEN
jgi:hypothetical protein